MAGQGTGVIEVSTFRRTDGAYGAQMTVPGMKRGALKFFAGKELALFGWDDASLLLFALSSEHLSLMSRLTGH